MNNLVVRLITGGIFVSLILSSIFIDVNFVFGVFSLFAVLGIIEFYKLFQPNEFIEINWRTSSFFAVFIFGLISCSLMGYLNLIGVLISIPAIFGFILSELWRKKKHPILNTAVNILGLVYVVLPFLIIVFIGTSKNADFPLLAGMFILIWVNDSFAYVVGRILGKHKLIERISPNKTWEGTIGGIAFTILAGVLISYFNPNESILFWVGSAVLLAPSAILGDLVESMFKRNLNIKDSGTILPGHGGILDRFDATIFGAPIFLFWIYFYTWFLS